MTIVGFLCGADDWDSVVQCAEYKSLPCRLTFL